jgi:drug/metabolite transporter (DMT)-like permease
MSEDRLSLTQILLLIGYAAGMAGGQLLFKLAAVRVTAEGPLGERALSLLQNRFFLAAFVLYGALAVLWVWILTFTPLSRAYPFVALAFALTPLLGAYAFAEPLGTRLVIGVAFIMVGLLFVAG